MMSMTHFLIAFLKPVLFLKFSCLPVCLLPSWAAAHHHSSVAQHSHRLSLWRKLPRDLWSQRESRARVSTSKDGSLLLAVKQTLNTKQHFSINMLHFDALICNFRYWVFYGLSFKTWHFNTGFLYVDSDGQRMTRNSTPFKTPAWWKKRILGPLWYPIMGTLQSTREPIAVTPQTN